MVKIDIRGKFTEEEGTYLFKDPLMICQRAGSIVRKAGNGVEIEADITGIDKIYYKVKGDQITISNRFLDLFTSIDEEMMPFQLLKGYVPYPFTLDKQVRKALPGMITKVTPKKVKYSPGPTLNIFSHKPFDENDFRVHLTSILKMNCSQDVISSFSGGYDSLFLTKIHQEYCKEILHFSEDKEVDVEYYRQVFPGIPWKIVGTDVGFTDADVKLYFNSIDEPCCDPSGFAEFMMVRARKDAVIPLMNGQSMDGIFANGRKYYQAYVGSKLPGFVRKWATGLRTKKGWLPQHIHDYGRDLKTRFFKFYTDHYEFPAMVASELDEVYALYKSSIKNDDVNTFAALVMMLRYSVYEIEKMKTSTRAYGIKYYLPIVATNVVDYAFSIPSKRKVGFKLGKKVLRQHFNDISNIKFISRDFVPNELKERLIGEPMSEPAYKKYFIENWRHFHGA